MGGKGSGRPKKWVGAPTKLTPQLSAEICHLVEIGNYLETAAAAVGVQPKTIRSWVAKGVKGRGRSIYSEFATAYKSAEARAEAGGLVRIREAGRQAWQADAWFMERRWPKKWGRWERHEHTGPDGQAVEGQGSVVVYLPRNGREAADQ